MYPFVFLILLASASALTIVETPVEEPSALTAAVVAEAPEQQSSAPIIIGVLAVAGIASFLVAKRRRAQRHEDHFAAAREHVDTMRGMGHDDESIRTAFEEHGWSQDQLEKVLR
jgi:LPXTG-motif cell wall-anchored protein